MIDAGEGHDAYAFAQSTGLGKADYTGWALFVDEGGNDLYTVNSGFGEASEQSLSGFFDLAGKDSYTTLDPPSTSIETHPANGIARRHSQGGVFVDR